MNIGDNIIATLPGSWLHGHCGTVLTLDVTDENGEWGTLVKIGSGISILADDEMVALPSEAVRLLELGMSLIDHTVGNQSPDWYNAVEAWQQRTNALRFHLEGMSS